MANFSHLQALEVKQTARYEIQDITVNGLTPVLIVKPATDANKSYFNQLLKQAGKLGAAKRRSVKLTTLEDSREEDRKLYPKHILVGWENVLDGATGEEVNYTEADGEDFLQNLPNWLFDNLRLFCSDPSNFTDQLDIEVKGKN